MQPITEEIATRSGLKLQIEKRQENGRAEITLRTDDRRSCVLHWGLQRGPCDAWQVPPESAWPTGTKSFGKAALQTPFANQNGQAGIILQLEALSEYRFIDFALFFPAENQWDNNNGSNYQVALPASDRASELDKKPKHVFKDEIAQGDLAFERVFQLDGDRQLIVKVVRDHERLRLLLATDLSNPLLLHWGLALRSSLEWAVPPAEQQPPGTSIWQNSAAETPFKLRDGQNRLVFEWSEAEAPLGIHFVLQESGSGRWIKFKGGNFSIPLRKQSAPTGSINSPELARLAQEIIQSETQRNSWTLMHRFTLCHDRLDRVRNDVDGLALIFVWLRFSAIRQLTWQRNYNTQPRELSHAQDRLTQKLSDIYRHEPASRRLARLMLTTIGRGGEGQRIRDEILQIMHRHHIKEMSGHFMEEWHQKLHNNTTPDDVVICEAFLEFLRTDGNRDVFYKTLQAGGVTKERLESFERPIRSEPVFVGHLKEALQHDFGNFLRTLRSVHSGTDFETAIKNAEGQLDDDLRNRLWRLWRHRNDSHGSAVDLANQTVEACRRLAQYLPGHHAIRDLLYLQLALEQFLRAIVERNIHLQLSGDQLVDLLDRVLEVLLMSEEEAELSACLRHWQKVKNTPRFGRDWSRHAKSVLDRLTRALGGIIDRDYQLLQPKAEFLGHGFQAEVWTITLFSEGVVRGSLIFALSMLLHHLDPLLRRSANLGDWKVISRGAGSGTVEVVDSLRSIQSRKFERPTVIITDQVMGDEEIPEGVTAVIAPDVTDIVSHVAVRARNAHLLFAACYDSGTLTRLKGYRGRQLQLQLTPAGDVAFKEGTADEQGTAVVQRRSRSIRIQRPRFSEYAIGVKEFSPEVVGGKSYRQAELRKELPDWIKSPASVALPFGVFEHVLELSENKAVLERYENLVKQVEQQPQKVLSELRQTVLEMKAPEVLVSSLRKNFQQAGLSWPERWDSAWNCIKQVWASKWNDRAYYSRKARNIPHEDLVMAVLIQSVVEAEYAFVIHTVNPFSGNSDELYAEVVVGLGETLVGNYPGRALSFTWNKRTNELTLLAYPSKSIGLFGGGLIFRSDSNGEDQVDYAGAGLYDSILLPPPREQVLDYSHERLVWDEAFRNELLRTLSQLGVEIERALRSPQDIEGAWVRGEFYLVQTRPQVGTEPT